VKQSDLTKPNLATALLCEGIVKGDVFGPLKVLKQSSREAGSAQKAPASNHGD
jgi:hypothetical protein